jgi:hypothetical protein
MYRTFLRHQTHTQTSLFLSQYLTKPLLKLSISVVFIVHLSDSKIYLVLWLSPASPAPIYTVNNKANHQWYEGTSPFPSPRLMDRPLGWTMDDDLWERITLVATCSFKPSL